MRSVPATAPFAMPRSSTGFLFAPESTGATVADQAYRRLVEAILFGDLAASQRLVLQDLAEQFGVSLTPVREALQRLAAEGLIEASARRGFRIRTPSPRHVTELWQVRLGLELAAGELAVARLAAGGDPTALRRMQAIQAELDAKPVLGHRRHLELNTRFHQALIEASGNRLLGTLYHGIQMQLLGGWVQRGSQEWRARLASERAEHHAIVDALAAGDVRALAVAIRQHLGRSLEGALRDVAARAADVEPDNAGRTTMTDKGITRRASLLAGLGAAALPVARARAQATTIRMWTFLNPTGNAPREKALADIIAQFEAANPGVKIAVETQVWDQMTPKFLAAAQQGNAPDIVWVITDLLGDAINSGQLADLRTLFINKWSPAQVADNAGPYWDLCNVNNKQYCLFTSRNYMGMFYRKDLFAAAGIDVASLTSWPVFIEAAKKLMERDASGNVTRWGYGQGWSEAQADPQLVVNYLLAKQGTLFDETGRAKFATPAGIEGLTLQTDMVTRHQITPRQVVSWTVDDLIEQFSAGRVAIANGASVRFSGILGRMGADKAGFMLVPGIDGKPNSPSMMLGWAVSVWSKSRNIEAAGRFVEFMSGAEADKLWVAKGGQTPGLISTPAAMPDFFADPANVFLRVAAYGSANAGWLSPISFGVGGFRQSLNKAAQEVVTNGLTPQAALERAERDFNRRNNR
jgi:multiple sugar transport system substrate-binding protein